MASRMADEANEWVVQVTGCHNCLLYNAVEVEADRLVYGCGILRVPMSPCPCTVPSGCPLRGGGSVLVELGYDASYAEDVN